MTARKHRRQQTTGEEVANSITHGVAAALSVAALVVLVVFASLAGDPWRIVSFSIYGAALVILYLISTLYHSFPWPRVKQVFRRLDHASIFLLIAGTYTPFTLITLRGGWGWSLFGVVWGLALFGIVFESFFVGRWQWFSIGLYIAMGWCAVVALRPMLSALPLSAMAWIAAGGFFYTVGVLFYAWKRLPYHHTVWHLFVMSGSAAHFIALFLFVLPTQA